MWYVRTGHRRQYKMAHVLCMLDNEDYKTHSECVILIAFPHQQWLRERASTLRNMFVACLVRLFLSSCTSDFLFFLYFNTVRKHKFSNPLQLFDKRGLWLLGSMMSNYYLQ